jgi:hypothetical protein
MDDFFADLDSFKTQKAERRGIPGFLLFTLSVLLT